MLSSQLYMPMANFEDGDIFSGGGGASTAFEIAAGKYMDFAINHDGSAIRMHKANHPQTRHFCSNIYEVDPIKATLGRPVRALWASPDCKHFSKAKGGKPRDKNIRSLAWVITDWAEKVHPLVIFVENVEEFKTWGPLDKNNQPIAERKGETFNEWVNKLHSLGYTVEWKELRACDYGAPTSRKRLFIVARRDNEPIVWPEATHGNPKKAETKAKKLKPWRTAAECIDWSIPCPSIFERKKPLSENTLRRIAKGIKKFVIDNPEPFIVQVNHAGNNWRGQNIDKPLSTVTAKNGSAIIVPTCISVGYGGDEKHPRVPGLDKPLRTITAGGGKHALIVAFLSRQYGQSIGTAADTPLGTITQIDHSNLVTAFLAKHYSGIIGTELEKPLGTITTVDHHSLVTSHITKLRGTNIGHSADEPLHTISAQGKHFGEVRALLIKYYGNDKDGCSLDEPLHTIPTKDRFGLITVYIKGEPYVIVDIGMRMLQPHELYAAQGFPANYIIDRDINDKPLTKTEQVKMCGNSVSPPPAIALIRVNLPKTDNYHPLFIEKEAA